MPACNNASWGGEDSIPHHGSAVRHSRGLQMLPSKATIRSNHRRRKVIVAVPPGIVLFHDPPFLRRLSSLAPRIPLGGIILAGCTAFT